jgi:hypothetical protein
MTLNICMSLRNDLVNIDVLFESYILVTNRFDVLSVIRRLHNLWSPFKGPFCLVPLIVFSFRAHALFYLGTKRRLSWNSTNVPQWIIHDNRCMNTSADVLNSKCHRFRLFCLSLCKAGARGRERNCTFQYRLRGSNKPSLQYFQFCRFGRSWGIPSFSILELS